METTMCLLLLAFLGVPSNGTGLGLVCYAY